MNLEKQEDVAALTVCKGSTYLVTTRRSNGSFYGDGAALGFPTAFVTYEGIGAATVDGDGDDDLSMLDTVLSVAVVGQGFDLLGASIPAPPPSLQMGGGGSCSDAAAGAVLSNSTHLTLHLGTVTNTDSTTAIHTIVIVHGWESLSYTVATGDQAAVNVLQTSADGALHVRV